MERNIDLNEISDGKRYKLNDMVKADCGNCEGCSSCCKGMGNSIVLDPFDVYRLTTGLNSKFEELLLDKLDLNVVEGIILPNLKMTGENNGCGFLDEQERCSVHNLRPGICRIFPLGRVYENESFDYILQVNECKKKNRSKIKVKKWIDTPDVDKNQIFIIQWHYFLKEISKKLPMLSEKQVKEVNMLILNVFFVTLYERKRDFYEQFNERMESVKKTISEML